MLAGLQLFIGLTALAGGYQLVSDPSGISAGVPLQWLGGSPFQDYLIPGWTLLVVIGVGSAGASLATALGHRLFGKLAVVQGALLVVYIAVEVWAIGWRVAPQPLYLMLGLVQIVFGRYLDRTAAGFLRNVAPEITRQPAGGEGFFGQGHPGRRH